MSRPSFGEALIGGVLALAGALLYDYLTGPR